MSKTFAKNFDAEECCTTNNVTVSRTRQKQNKVVLISFLFILMSTPFALYNGIAIGNSHLTDNGLIRRELQALRADYSTTRWKDGHESARGQKDACRLKSSPVPVILMSLGRSGSSSTWQLMGDLTGASTPATELTGSSELASISFFNKLSYDDKGKWALDYFCELQKRHPGAGIVGFKWKPYDASIFTETSIDTLRMIAALKDSQIKIVRSRRNLIDREISNYKHQNDDYGFVPAHCKVGDLECLKTHEIASTGLVVPVKKLLEQIYKEFESEERVDQLLKELNVPHIHVSYEKLYFGEDIAAEWMRIFDFLGVGPAQGLTNKQVHDAMRTAATFNPSHQDTLGNFDELRDALKNTPFENMLHL